MLLPIFNCYRCKKSENSREWFIIDLCANTNCYLAWISKYHANYFFCEKCYPISKHFSNCRKCDSIKINTEYLGIDVEKNQPLPQAKSEELFKVQTQDNIQEDFFPFD